MLRTALSLATSLALLTAVATPASATPCRDAKGKVITCPENPADQQVFKDAEGNFAKCGTPVAKPA